MLLSKVTLPLSVLQIAAAHTVFTTLFVNGVNQGDGTCIRMPVTPNNCTDPISDLASNDMACGFDGTVGVARVCPVTQASDLTFLFREYADGSQPGAIDASHKGPCAVYMKAVTSPVTDAGYGAGWFKIWESGYDNKTSQWCTEKLIQDNGLLSVNVPSDLAGGYYLVRPELLALHQADKNPPNPQFYTGCAQIFIQSNATAVPLDTVSIPGYVHADDPSVLFNIYTPSWPYPMPGPTPYEGIIISIRDKSSDAAMVQTEGLMPEDCVLSNANWCGVELDSYSTETGCWNASEACYAQDTTCYSSAPPTGSKNCPIWEAKCKEIQDNCNTGNFDGPPNKGKNLNPSSTATYSIPPVAVMKGVIPSSTPTTISTALYSADTQVPPSLVTDTYFTILSPTQMPQSQISTTSIPSSTNTAITTPTITLSIPSNTIHVSSSSTSSLLPHSSPPNVTIPIPISHDATCGASLNRTCLNSAFGSCCSQYGWCGISPAYCGAGCQTGYGTCGHGVLGQGKSDGAPEKAAPAEQRRARKRAGHLYAHRRGGL